MNEAIEQSTSSRRAAPSKIASTVPKATASGCSVGAS
jgi:hypothetical protein